MFLTRQVFVKSVPGVKEDSGITVTSVTNSTTLHGTNGVGVYNRVGVAVGASGVAVGCGIKVAVAGGSRVGVVWVSRVGETRAAVAGAA